MPRPAITPAQRIMDLFAEMEVSEQAPLMEKLTEMHRFCVKRDARLTKQKSAESREQLSLSDQNA